MILIPKHELYPSIINGWIQTYVTLITVGIGYMQRIDRIVGIPK